MKKILSFIIAVVCTMSISSYYIKEQSSKVIASSQEVKELADPIEIYEVVTYYDLPLSKEYQDYLRDECEMAGVELELVLAVMKVESGFNPKAVSGTNDYGIMQINECNHDTLIKELGISDFFDPYDCARAGIYMLSNLTWCETETEMLMCYNMGIAGAKRAWNKGINETDYTKKVLQAKNEIGGKSYEIEILCN